MPLGRTQLPRLFGALAAAAFTVHVAGIVKAATPWTLPIEVVGEAGATAAVDVDLPAGRVRDVRSLWMQIHGLSYADMVSVQVNGTAWVPLDNGTVAIADPGRSHGGIGGAFATLKMTLALPPNTVVAGANTIRFRFNGTDGVASGFRVLAFNLLAGDASRILDAGAFAQDDPAAWTPPLTDPASIQSGQKLWQSATLTASGLADAPKIRAHCSECHAWDGRDLKYFNFSNASIVARSRFHGLSDLEGRQIASYIRSLPGPNPGRPWNPPYQPGPGLDAQPVANWAAGAGLSWALESDTSTLPFIFAPDPATRRSIPDSAGSVPNWSAILPGIGRDVFRPDGNLNAREIPISLQLPDWNHWLPRVHPLDAWGAAFERSDFSRLYDGSRDSLRRALAPPGLANYVSSGRIVTAFDNWTKARRELLRPYVEGDRITWSPDLALRAYSTELWQLVKTWEVTQEFGLEGRGRELFGGGGEARTWFNTIPASTAPKAANIPSSSAGMGGSAAINEYFNASWYELQLLVNSGNHQHRGRLPVDWLYVIGGFQDLQGHSRRPEPGRLLVALIKAMQSTDPAIGPNDIAQGWRPALMVDPTLVVKPEWAPTFEPLPRDSRRVIAESILGAWLDKNQQYRVDRYFRVGLSESSYAVPARYASIAGGKPWESAPWLLEEGVNPDLVRQLQRWGASYTEMAARFQYAPARTSAPPSSRDPSK